MHEKIYIYGKNAVEEALIHTPNIIERVFFEQNFHDAKIHELTRNANIPMGGFTDGTAPHGVSRDIVHQGIIALLKNSKFTVDYNHFIKNLKVSPSTCLVILDELQDPNNVGAIIRSAVAFGISGVLIPEHNQAQVTGAVLKASAGMALHTPLVAIGNINNTIRDLKDKGFWIYGLDETAEKSLGHEKFDAPAVFIFGNEEKGIREKTRELCDILLSIPMSPKCESLNVSASAAITLYEWSKGHLQALK